MDLVRKTNMRKIMRRTQHLKSAFFHDILHYDVKKLEWKERSLSFKQNTQHHDAHSDIAHDT